MNFGLDWDGTVNQAYALWAIWTREAIRAGHRVYVVTMRYASEVDDHMYRWCFNNGVRQIIYTDRGPKRPAAEKQGIKIDVWIDDNPRAVEEGAENIWGAATPEGQVVEDNETVTAEFPSPPVPDPFEAAWEKMEARGYRYGRDALEQVRLGWTMAQAENAALAAGACCEPVGGLTADEGGTPYCAMKRERDRLMALDRPRVDKLNALDRENATLQRERDEARQLLEQECADIDKLMDAFHLRPQMFRTEGGRLRVNDLAQALRLMMRPNG